MNSFPVIQLKDKTYFTNELLLDKQFVLLSPTVPFSEQLKKALLDWDFSEVFSEGKIGVSSEAGVDYAKAAEAKKAEAGGDGNKKPLQKLSESDFEEVSFDFDDDKNSSAAPAAKVQQSVPQNQNPVELESRKDKDSSRMENVEKEYEKYINYVTDVYTHYATHKQLSYHEISDAIKELCIFVRDNRRYVLRLPPKENGIQANFLVSHSLRSTVLAIVMGLQLRLTFSKLIELGVACVLHEIGQIRLPPQLYMTNRKLNPGERSQLAMHPVIGFNILKENNFPLAIQLAVLEHHERENGTGYPRHIDGSKMSMYAKIIAVACSFEAITAPRNYKENRSAYEAMLEILKNSDKQYNDLVIKALLFSVSIFPIGVYVYMVDGRIAQVVDTNPTDPRNPIVQIVSDANQEGGGELLQTNSGFNKIVRVLNHKEVKDIFTAMKTTKSSLQS